MLSQTAAPTDELDALLAEREDLPERHFAPTFEFLYLRVQ
jgi:hypothetical protein